MKTVKGNNVDTMIIATITKGFRFDEVTVPPSFEAELLGAVTTRRTVRFRRGQRVACKTWADFSDLRAKADAYGGEVQLR